MEIGPIPGIRAVPAVKAPPANAGLSAVFDIANSPGAGDDTYSGSGRKATGGQDDETEDEFVELESASESSESGTDFGSGGGINFVV